MSNRLKIGAAMMILGAALMVLAAHQLAALVVFKG